MFRNFWSDFVGQISWPTEAVGTRGISPLPPLFSKEKKKKCIIIAQCYTNVNLSVFSAQIHQKCAPNCAKLVHKIKNFPTSEGGTSPLRHPLSPLRGSLWSAIRAKLSPPPTFKIVPRSLDMVVLDTTKNVPIYIEPTVNQSVNQPYFQNKLLL